MSFFNAPDIKLATSRNDFGVRYSVTKDGKIIWDQTVYLGQDSAHRAGGSAFKEAAVEQERQAGYALNESIEESLEASGWVEIDKGGTE